MSKSLAEQLRDAGFVTEQQYAEHIAKQQQKDKSPIEQFREASVDNPVFAKITIYNEAKFDWETERDKPAISVWEGVVACEGTREVNIEESKWETRKAEQAVFRAMGDGKVLHPNEVSNLRMKAPEARDLEAQNYHVKEILAPTPQLTQQYQNVRDSISMTIHAYVFPEFKAPNKVLEPTNENWPKIRETMGNAREAMNNPLTKHIYQVKGLDNEVDAEKWMLKNHPEEAISFVYSTTTGNFNLQPAIDMLSPKSYLGTRADREDYVKELAVTHGIEIPAFNYKEADKVLAERAGSNKELYAVAYEKDGKAYPVTHGFDNAKEAEAFRQSKVEAGVLSPKSFVFRQEPNMSFTQPIPMKDVQKVGVRLNNKEMEQLLHNEKQQPKEQSKQKQKDVGPDR